MPKPGFPTRFAIFPLPNAVLFPEAVLPLHIFEPRYRAMTDAALEQGGILGMVLVKPGEDPMAERAGVYSIGCAGRMSEVQAMSDGRFNFLLTGVRRFRIVSESLEPGGFRVANVELLHDPDFRELDSSVATALERGREHLTQKVLELVQLQSPESVESLSERLSAFDPQQLVRALAFALACEPVAKQQLLETDSPLDQSALLTQLIEFLTAEARLPSSPRTVN
jgi:Lon protease-like protein